MKDEQFVFFLFEFAQFIINALGSAFLHLKRYDA